MKPNVKVRMKIDGKLFWSANFTVGCRRDLSFVCDDLCDAIATFEQVGSVDGGHAVEMVEPMFRADK